MVSVQDANSKNALEEAALGSELPDDERTAKPEYMVPVVRGWAGGCV